MGICKGTEAWKDGSMSRERAHMFGEIKQCTLWRIAANMGSMERQYWGGREGQVRKGPTCHAANLNLILSQERATKDFLATI